MRKQRILIDGHSYHVTARINRQEFLFDKENIKEMFLKVLEEAKLKFNFGLKNFCIMGNHIHLIIKPFKGENLSKIMQWILGVFAQRYNRRFTLKGHVWYDRFKSKVIFTLRQYFNTFFYISNNPVKAGLVHKAAEYEYSGITHMLKGIAGIIDKPPEKTFVFLLNKLISES